MTPAARQPAASNASKDTSKKKAAGASAVLTARGVATALKQLRDAIVAEFPDPNRLVVLGIRTRGVTLAERLAALLEDHYGDPVPLGVLDITLYRDDLSTLGPQPMVRDSEIPFDITGRQIVLVDDVLYTGRTIRAAMDELIDFGRPDRIRLAVLIDRGGREYPIQADYVGKTVKVPPGRFIRVHLDEIDGRDEVVLLEKS